MFGFVQSRMCFVKRFSTARSIELGSICDVRSLIMNTTTKSFLRPNSDSCKDLVNLIEDINDPKEMNKVKNILIKKFKMSYSPLSINLIQQSENKLFMKLRLFRHIGEAYDKIFLELAESIISNSKLTNNEKKEQLYKLIKFQTESHTMVTKKKGWILPSNLHKWFWENIERNDSFNHYYFLIQNKIRLSTCKYSIYFTRRLLMGSELERHLVSFKLFMEMPEYKKEFLRTFKKSYNVETMVMIINSNIKLKDFRYIDEYFSILLQKVETLSNASYAKNNEDRAYVDLCFIRFSNCLLYYLSTTRNTKMFMETFNLNISRITALWTTDISTYKGDKKKFQESLLREAQKAIGLILKIIQANGMQEEMFEVLSLPLDGTFNRSKRFRKYIVSRLLTSIAQFYDSKLLLNYIISSYKSKHTALLLNDLGLWGHISHNNTTLLSKKELLMELKNINKSVPNKLSISALPSHHVLSLIYKVVFTIDSRTLSKEDFQNLLVDLYKKYKTEISKVIHKENYWRTSSSVLSIFLYQARYVLKDSRLAYNMLKDFYKSDIGTKIYSKGSMSPFSLVVYNNEKITMSEINSLLEIMESKKISLDLKFCIEMITRFLKLGDEIEAHKWYKKILNVRFEMKHMKLIAIAVKQSWEFPSDFDRTLLEKLDDKETINRDDELLIEDNNPDDYQQFKTTVLKNMNNLFSTINESKTMQY